MYKFFLAGILLLMIRMAMAEGNEELMQKANKDYSSGLYANAINGYLQVIEKGYESDVLYFNLGNAYFKTNDLASAILYYEKARKINPNDEDINYNLNVANSRIKDKIEEVPQLFYKRWWQTVLHLFSGKVWTRIHVATFIFFLALAALYFLSRQRIIRKVAFWTGAVVLVITIISFSLAFQNYRSFRTVQEAIVFDPSLTVKSSPTENSIDLFVIHEGTKVRITESLGDWMEIRIANGSTGWIPGSSIRMI
jgi:tetratricopeptide (TPR) repeat protein